ncbi:MAG: DUF6624 domain-containing protein [Thiofilum sp.]|uniref:DUF6624 domain-containing protein n=1 Tax=Thiofilum sp. TaxID=2212733 RepID=UPI0025CCD7A9|nr:DUF6624 domain-containing protein [Thiofilum sp.]MBK8452312.1 hypothetical protein [Thiofilum sp.]
MNSELRTQLIEMKQQMDQASYAGEALEPLDPNYSAKMRSLQGNNAQRLNNMIDEYGSWPTVAMVGEEGAYAAWSIAQYANEWPTLQRKFLATLNVAAARGEVTQRQLAFLLDRVRFNQGQAQFYGTFLDWDTKGELSAEIEQPETLDERRKAVGLPAYEFTRQRQMEEVAQLGGKAPSDLKAYKQAQLKWAQKLGWR